MGAALDEDMVLPALQAVATSRLEHLVSLFPGETVKQAMEKIIEGGDTAIPMGANTGNALQEVIDTPAGQIPLDASFSLDQLLAPETSLKEDDGTKVTLLDDLFPQDTPDKEKQPELSERTTLSSDAVENKT